jgi:hypothetical protein
LQFAFKSFTLTSGSPQMSKSSSLGT